MQQPHGRFTVAIAQRGYSSPVSVQGTGTNRARCFAHPPEAVGDDCRRWTGPQESRKMLGPIGSTPRSGDGELDGSGCTTPMVLKIRVVVGSQLDRMNEE